VESMLNFSDLPCFLMTISVRFLTGYLQLGPGVPDFQDFLCFYVLAELTGNNLSYIYLGSSVCHPVILSYSCRPVIVAER
jgi:hypothetical protein